MNTLFTVIAILVILAAILLTIVVLLQNGKGGGLASNFVAGNQTFGVRQTADILEKITWGLAVVIIVLSVVSNFTNSGSASSADAAAAQVASQQEAQAEDFSRALNDIQNVAGEAAPAQEDPSQE